MIENWQKQGTKSMVVLIDTAKEVSADYIVTRNLEDFKNSQVKAILPKELIEMLKHL